MRTNMLRNFDNWDVYLDDQNHQLHGCVQFMVRDGNTPAPIFDSDGTAIQNPQITNNQGRTQHQVFIDTDVVAYFYKYIGNGSWFTEDEIDTSDQSKWSLQFTVESIEAGSVNISSDSLKNVGSMEDLRDLDPSELPELPNGEKIINLLGYFEAGDKETVQYIWIDDSTEIDDGGSVIQGSSLTGRWHLVQPTEHCDSRHFGVFPQDTINGSDQSSGISNLMSYCNIRGIRPFFNGSENSRYFKFSNLDVVVDQIDVSDGTTFITSGTNSITSEWNGEPVFSGDGIVTITCSRAKTSWNATQYIGVREIIIDSDPDQKSWSDCHVDMRVTPAYGYTFRHCTFEENGNLGADNLNEVYNDFYNCKLNERMFILSGANQAHLDGHCFNCQIDPDDFYHSMYLFKEARCTSEQSPFFNYRDYPNVGKPYELFTDNVVLSSGGIWVTDLKNPLAQGVELEALPEQTSLILEGCTGWYSIPEQITTLVLRECSVALEINGPILVNAQNSDVEIKSMPSSGNVQTGEASIILRDSTLSGVTSEWSTFNAQNSTINSEILSHNTIIKSCTVNQKFSLVYELGESKAVTVPAEDTDTEITYTVSRWIHGFIDNNIFNGQLVIDAQYKNIVGDHSTTPYTTDYVLVDGLRIENNTSSVEVDPWYIWPCAGPWKFDDQHVYTFKNNSGTFTNRTVVSAVVKRDNSYQPGTPGSLIIDMSSGWGQLRAISEVSEYIEQIMSQTEYMDLGDQYFCTMRLFSIGTRAVKFDLKFTLSDNKGLNWNSETVGHGHLTDDTYGRPYFGWDDWEQRDPLPDVRSINQMNNPSTDPIFSPITTNDWSPIFQIRNFTIGRSNLAADSTVTVTIEQE